MTEAIIEKRKCYFCHKRGYADPNKPQNETCWYLEFYKDEEYHICAKCFYEGKIRCGYCGGEAKKRFLGVYGDEYEYEIYCPCCGA